ncbi:MAG: hypothetical protein H6767_01335 [Candidatus Peribacteria bacterium]|nr:MAG: hypothetical protein H6767_01335 [Candidatus Peribacteria bacterium]
MSLNTVDAIQEILQRPPSDDWRSLLASAIHDVRDKVGAEVARSLWKEKILKSPKYQRRRGKHQRQVQEYLDIRKELQQQRISAVYYTRFEVLGAYTSSFSREDWESLFSFIAQRLRERSLVVFPYSDAAILTKFFHLDKRDTTFHTFLNSQRKSDLQKKTITGKRVLEQLTMYWDEL